MNVMSTLQQRLAGALSGLVADPAPYLSYVRPGQAGRGDYQIEAKCFFELCNALGRPRDKTNELAAEVVGRLQVSDLFEPPAPVAPKGPPFVNLNLKNDALADLVRKMAVDERLGVEPPAQLRTYVVDYSSPNVAKPLHVGHVRSTIIGDAVARLLRFLGHKVITDNHLGDWGLQFGMLLYGYKTMADQLAYRADPVRELARLYVAVRKKFRMIESADDEEEEKIDPNCPVYQACQQETAKLHAGDPENVALWKKFMPPCVEEIRKIYERLGVLPFDHQHGESFYHSLQAAVVEDMLAKKLAEVSEGAVVIPNAKGEIPRTKEEREKTDPPAIIRKRDGAFTYTTSDLATIKYRMETFHPDGILYVVGLPQTLHFKTLFAQARRWGYEKVELQHLGFGSVLGKPENPDEKPKLIRTRAGGGTLLDELLSLAIEGARKVHESKLAQARERGEEVPAFSDEEKRQIHEAVGIGAVKYADLSQNRTSDYVFDVDKMTATDGNTATYMQYAYVRARGILRKSGVDPEALRKNPPAVLLTTPPERALALALVRFPEALAFAASDYRPNLISAYLWDLCGTLTTFYDKCSVLKAETPHLRDSRLLLCDLTARVIQKALELLGIATIERM
jgi:arginyl-tRNA synthetase